MLRQTNVRNVEVGGSSPLTSTRLAKIPGQELALRLPWLRRSASSRGHPAGCHKQLAKSVSRRPVGRFLGLRIQADGHPHVRVTQTLLGRLHVYAKSYEGRGIGAAEIVKPEAVEPDCSTCRQPHTVAPVGVANGSTGRCGEDKGVGVSAGKAAKHQVLAQGAPSEGPGSRACGGTPRTSAARTLGALARRGSPSRQHPAFLGACRLP
jgi:hypothetical protein